MTRSLQMEPTTNGHSDPNTPPEKSDFEKLLEKDFKPANTTERILSQRANYWWLASRFLASNFFAKKFRSIDAIFSAMLYGARFGWDPWTSLQNCYDVQGTINQSAASMLAVAVSGGATYEIKESGRNGNPGQVGEWCEFTLHRPNFKSVTKMWTKSDVARAAIGGIHSKYPAQMLQWRAVADACRFLYADKLCGVLAVEEINAQIENIPGGDTDPPMEPPASEKPKRSLQAPAESETGPAEADGPTTGAVPTAIPVVGDGSKTPPPAAPVVSAPPAKPVKPVKAAKPPIDEPAPDDADPRSNEDKADDYATNIPVKDLTAWLMKIPAAAKNSAMEMAGVRTLVDCPDEDIRTVAFNAKLAELSA